jgi:hypothetical protein
LLTDPVASPPYVRREDYCWQALLRKPLGIDALRETIKLLIGKPVTATGVR